MSILRRIVESARVETRSSQAAISPSDLWGPAWGDNPGQMTEARANCLAAWHSATSLIAESIAGMPQGLYVRRGKARYPTAPPRWLHNPNPDDTLFSYEEKVVQSLLNRGNAYELLIRDRSTQIVERWVLDPTAVTPKRNAQNQLVYEVVYEVAPGRKATATLTSVDILHTKAYTSPGSDVGAAPIDRMSDTLRAIESTEEFARRLWQNGAHLNVILETDQNLDAAGVASLREGFKSLHQGLGSAHVPAVLAGGVKAKTITPTNEALQFLESQRWNVEVVARIFRIPPHLLSAVGGTSSWVGEGVQAMGSAFVVFTISPFLERLEQSRSRLFMNDEFIRYNPAALLRGDMKTRYESYQIGLQNGWLNQDDIRALEDLPPTTETGHDWYFRTLNIAPLDFIPDTGTSEKRPRSADPGTNQDDPEEQQ